MFSILDWRRMRLSLAIVLASTTAAVAADLPTRKAAPASFLRACSSQGEGFFLIPGSDTCLRVGGLVEITAAVSNTPNRYNLNNGGYEISKYLTGAELGTSTDSPGVMPSAVVPSTIKDSVSALATARIEADARTTSPWGTVRAFMRMESVFGAGASANTGTSPSSIVTTPSYGGGWNPTTGPTPVSMPSYAGTNAARETTWLSKAFLQFAGLTIGRAQSMFDFYQDSIGYTPHPGSNQTVNEIAYTLTFGRGFSASLSIEDQVSHRSNAVSVVSLNNAWIKGASFVDTNGALSLVNVGGSATPSAQMNGTRLPDIVANLRLEQPWGALQAMGALHQNRGGLYTIGGAAPGAFYPSTYFGAAGGAQPWPGLGNFANTTTLGFAVGAGARFALDMIAPGDQLWIQGIFSRGAVAYVTGNNFNFNNGVNTSNSYAYGLGRISLGNGWSGGQDYDCVWTYAGACKPSQGIAATAAFLHFWTPTISSWLTASYLSISYTNDSTNPIPGALAVGSTHAGMGMTNYRQTILATGVEWEPVRNFGIGAEFGWTRGMIGRPIGLAYQPTLALNGIGFSGTGDLFRGKLRMSRAF